jgi:HEAT repeat protein
MNDVKPPFQKVIDALLDESQDFPRLYLRDFSDIDPAALSLLMRAWPGVATDRKRVLLEELQALSDTDTLVSFDDFARALLNDPEAQVRRRAIRLLAECEDPKLIPALLHALADDEDKATRSEAASVLGSFVRLGELEEIPAESQEQVEQALLLKIKSEDQAGIRRRALESLGYSSRPEVAPLIAAAFARADPDWQAAALNAMGHSCDERWRDQVMLMLLNDDPRIQLAAIKSAGELELKEARPILIQILLDEEVDDGIVAAGIWSLSQIGGEEARVYIEGLLDATEDEDLVEFLEEALDNLAFTEDMAGFDLIALDPDDELLDDEIVDSEDEDG